MESIHKVRYSKNDSSDNKGNVDDNDNDDDSEEY